MRLRWTSAAQGDLARLHEFLKTDSPGAAARVVQMLVAAPEQLLKAPRLGQRLEEFSPREVRRIIVGRYEMRYEVADQAVFILRIWHTREDR
ncbi:type II toxin-antitoxin system RelE/ParE family toxin [Youhaiella tibetensis]|uniref:Type II toxin-antitoxin system RelE/ParE family toxin n=1 Tax=Paradevosia tibetensis TaxID=1447062 RepID=A0A5B9DNQ3_9HYPH|nr:type II toxin-antitoxin system RelE/ParE family toxin [Youhaiella tibetensis]QEE21021.1 type II toxin-antitoxin system RelE/ParE family toxin [Youhaiella tibetensis]